MIWKASVAALLAAAIVAAVVFEKRRPGRRLGSVPKGGEEEEFLREPVAAFDAAYARSFVHAQLGPALIREMERARDAVEASVFAAECETVDPVRVAAIREAGARASGTVEAALADARARAGRPNLLSGGPLLRMCAQD